MNTNDEYNYCIHFNKYEIRNKMRKVGKKIKSSKSKAASDHVPIILIYIQHICTPNI